MYIGLDEIDPIKFEEPHVVETVEPEHKFSLFKKKDETNLKTNL